jgi:hypothetical protein
MDVVSGLKGLSGIKPGDKVGISAVNCLEVVCKFNKSLWLISGFWLTLVV